MRFLILLLIAFMLFCGGNTSKTIKTGSGSSGMGSNDYAYDYDSVGLINDSDEETEDSRPEKVRERRKYKASRKNSMPKLVEPQTAEYENIMSQLSDGVIVFRIPTEMTVGESYRAEVRIDDSISVKLTQNLEGHQPIIHVEESISNTMKVLLIGDAFDIEPLTSEVQLRKRDKPTIWLWDVKPLKSGKQTLIVRATAILKRPGYSDETYDYDTIEEQVIVDVDVMKTVMKWMIDNWLKSVLTAIVLTIFAWFSKKILKKKNAKS